ncbi:MAG: hypothetical protein CMJ89_06070 [Planctomycetes bacterium]|nr:hypothetical protein [Planctomycetota bacterium]
MGLGENGSRRAWLLNAWLTAGLCAGLLVVGNRWARRQLNLRVDLSEDQLYAPSPVGRRLLSELKDVLKVRAYFTGRSRLGPVQIAKRRLIDQLLEFEDAAGGRIDLSFVDPNESSEARAEATELGIQPYPMSAVQGTSQVTQDTWLGLCMRYRGRERVVPFVLPQGFEYSFLTSLQNLKRDEDPVVGFVTGTGRGDPDGFAGARALLERQYRLREVLDLSIGEMVPEDVSVLVVARPRELPVRAAFAIDQFLQRGGRALFLCDRAEVDLRQRAVTTYATGLEPLLSAWGVRLTPQLVWDQRYPNVLRGRRSIQLEGRERKMQAESIPYPFWPKITLEGLDRENPVTARVAGADFFWTQALERDAPIAAATYEELVSSSKESWLIEPSKALDLAPDFLEAQAFSLAARGGGAPRVLAASLSGRLPSAFEAGAPVPMDPVEEALHQAAVERALQEGLELPRRQVRATHETVRSGQEETQVVLFGDADWITDGDYSSLQNQLLFVNLIDWLALEQDLLALRSRLPQEREIDDFLREEREALGLLGLRSGSGPSPEFAELEARAQTRAARRRHVRMFLASGGALAAGLLLYGMWFFLSARRVAAR